MGNCQNAFLTVKSTIIPLAGNTFFTNYGKKGIELTKTGISNWTDPSVSATIYVRFLEKGTYSFALNIKTKKRNRLDIQIGNKHQKVAFKALDWTKYDIGTFNIVDTGYVAIKIKSLMKEGETFGDIQSLEINASPDKFQFVKDEFYWGRRGPRLFWYTSQQRKRATNFVLRMESFLDR